MTATRLLFLIAVFSCTFIISNSAGWKKERRAKFMGARIPMKEILPSKRRIQRKILQYHNYFRATVVPKASNMLKMTWHRGASKAAQLWSNKCMFLDHDNSTGRYIEGYGACGQNIFISSHLVPWLFAIKTWWGERANFTYGSKKNELKLVGHYTQMIWASSHEIGCGLNKCHRYGNKTGMQYFSYICNYCPIGNIEVKLGRPYRKGDSCSKCKRLCSNRRLCTNSCQAADQWSNCRKLFKVWPGWLCHSDSVEGQERKHFCLATCTCKGKIYD